MSRADLLSITFLLAGTLVTANGWSAELPRRGAPASHIGASVSLAPASGADGAASVQSVHGYHLSPAELAKLREQVRLHWMQGRAPTAADGTSGVPLADEVGRALSR